MGFDVQDIISAYEEIIRELTTKLVTKTAEAQAYKRLLGAKSDDPEIESEVSDGGNHEDRPVNAE